MRTDRCRVCRCTQREPCNPPCSWHEPGLCSSCHELAETIRNWMDYTALRASFYALIRLVKEMAESKAGSA